MSQSFKAGIPLTLAALLITVPLMACQPEASQTAKPSAAEVPVADRGEDALWLIVPGKSVGPITAKTTLSDLERLYGAENVREQPIHVAEGEMAPGAVLFPDDPQKRLELFWAASGARKTPESVRIYRTDGSESLWHTAEGVTLGTTLKELETLNEGPFKLTGFDWDYGGTVLSWGDAGKLHEPFQKDGRLILRLSPPYYRVENLDTLDVSGDAEFSSAHPAMQRVNPEVDRIIIVFQ